MEYCGTADLFQRTAHVEETSRARIRVEKLSLGHQQHASKRFQAAALCVAQGILRRNRRGDSHP